MKLTNQHWDPFRSPLGIVRLILMTHWDPIGVFGYPGALDEYDDYAPPVLSLLQDNATVEQIAEHLHHVEKKHSGFKNTVANRLHTATLLVNTFADAKRLSLAEPS